MGMTEFAVIICRFSCGHGPFNWWHLPDFPLKLAVQLVAFAGPPSGMSWFLGEKTLSPSGISSSTSGINMSIGGIFKFN
jgi:hypothetical protein